jgi:hypothetical protein
MKLKTIAASFVLTLVAGLAVAPLSTAFADAPDGGHASCMGFEGSAVSPPGSNDEFPDGGKGMVAEFKFLAELFGFKNAGQLFALFTKLSMVLGVDSHDDCDEAAGG